MVPISLSVPGAAVMADVDAVAILDSGSGITTLPAEIANKLQGIANKLQAAFPDVQVVGGMAHPGKLKVADGRVLVVQERTCPVRIALHTSWGLVTMDPSYFAVMPGDDDVVILGNPTLRLLGINVYDTLRARTRQRAALTGVDTAAYRQCRRVIVSVDALQQQPRGTPEEPDEAVERMVAREPDIDMNPEEKLRARSEALEEAVLASASAGLDESHVERLCDVIGRRWNAFRRGLRRGDPPARVEPLRVTLKPGARPVKARPRVYNPVKSAWLAACTASLAALGLVFFNMQGVWASAAMATTKKGGFPLGSDFRAANQRVEKVPGVMPNQEASMVKLSEAKFYGSLHLLQCYWQCPLAPEARSPRRAVCIRLPEYRKEF